MITFHLKSAVIVSTLLFAPNAAALRGLITAIHDEADAPLNEQSLDTNKNDRDLETRIVGGTQASVGEYPYYTQWIYGCGASLIHDDIVLTAAHCGNQKTYTVHVGAFQQQTISDGAILATIAKRVVHPKWNPNTIAYDFQILKLTSPVDKVPVNLNRNNTIPTSGEDLVAVGMGELTTNGNIPAYLQEVTVQAVDHNTCKKKLAGNSIAASMVCAAATGKSTCFGDSGGPLVEILNGVHTLVGVTSWSVLPCAAAGYPSVYARVSDQVAWIDQQICALSSKPPVSCGTTMPTTTSVSKPTKAPKLTKAPKPTKAPK